MFNISLILNGLLVSIAINVAVLITTSMKKEPFLSVLIAVIIAGFTGFGVGYAFCNQTSKWLLDSTAWEKKHPSESSADAAIVPAPVVSSSKPRKTVLGRLNAKTKDHKS